VYGEEIKTAAAFCRQDKTDDALIVEHPRFRDNFKFDAIRAQVSVAVAEGMLVVVLDELNPSG